MGIVDGSSHGFQIVCRLSWRKWTPVEEICQTLALDVFHHKEVLALMIGNLVDCHDTGVSEPGSSPGFLPDSLDIRLRSQPARDDCLYRDCLVQTPLMSFIDNPHAAAPDFLENLVVRARVWRVGI